MTRPRLRLEPLEDRCLLSVMLLRDINPDAPSGMLFFSANYGQSGFEL